MSHETETLEASAVTRSRRRLTMEWFAFVVLAAAFVAFVALMFTDPSRLDSLWTSLRGLPIAVQVLIWLLLLPLVLALAVWQAGWAYPVRLVGVAAIAAVFLFMFFPKPAL
jgi:hypothetical protein